MSDTVNNEKRRYYAPRRAQAAAQTREAILRAAKSCFEARGWAGATIPVIAAHANVSPKTIEAAFGTKAELLAAVVDFAIRGDITDQPMIERAAGRAVEAAPDAPTMLERHLEYALPITARSARIAAVVESAAGTDERLSRVWKRMTHNRRFGARWAAEILLQKPGSQPGLTAAQAEQAFIIAIDWATYRTLHDELGLSRQQVNHWTRRYYHRMLLDDTTS